MGAQHNSGHKPDQGDRPRLKGVVYPSPSAADESCVCNTRCSISLLTFNRFEREIRRLHLR